MGLAELWRAIIPSEQLSENRSSNDVVLETINLKFWKVAG